MAEDDVRTPGAPAWWVKRLDAKLRVQRRRARHFHAYMEGDHPLRFATAKFKAAFGGLFEELADNFCSVVVEAVEERLNVEGFRIAGGTEGDSTAWRIWQENKLDAESELLHTESLVSSLGFSLVWKDPKSSRPKVTVESPEEVAVAMVPGDRMTRAAAWKVYRDDYSGRLHATLYLPDGLWKYESEQTVDADRTTLQQEVRWRPRIVSGEDRPLANPLKVVPVVPFPNRPKLLAPPSSELRNVTPVQDAINKLVADLLIASEYQSFRQRWATGIEIPTDPQTDKPIEPFNAAVDRLWMAEAPEARFGEFGQVDLSTYVQATEMFVQHIATQTRTPPHYFYLKGNLPSGESIKSAETGLVAKSSRKMRHYGEAWEETMRLALLVAGEDELAEGMLAGETIWRDPEYRSEGEHVDATLKMKSLGIPQEALWEELGFTPQQIERFKQIKQQEALELAAAAVTIGRPVTTAPAPPAVPETTAPEGNGQIAAPAPVG